MAGDAGAYCYELRTDTILIIDSTIKEKELRSERTAEENVKPMKVPLSGRKCSYSRSPRGRAKRKAKKVFVEEENVKRKEAARSEEEKNKADSCRLKDKQSGRSSSRLLCRKADEAARLAEENRRWRHA